MGDKCVLYRNNSAAQLLTSGRYAVFAGKVCLWCMGDFCYREWHVLLYRLLTEERLSNLSITKMPLNHAAREIQVRCSVNGLAILEWEG